jgi:hypothetical protein
LAEFLQFSFCEETKIHHLNRLKANIIKANAIPRDILFRKFRSFVFNRQKNKQVSVDEYTFGNNIGKPIDITPNIELFYTLLPELNDSDKYIKDLSDYCNAFLRHEFDLLGNGPINIDLKVAKDVFYNDRINPKNRNRALEIAFHLTDNYNLINWNIDSVSGYVWDISKKSHSLSYENLENTDVKFPWELGRLQHFISLAYISAMGMNEFFTELKNQFIDFVASNPPGYGIQWKSPMDVAIRSVNLIFTYAILKKHNVKTDEFFDNLFYTSLQNHIEYIFNNLEWNEGLRGNHYFFNLCGLIVGSVFLENNFIHNEIFLNAIRYFKQEILYQFHSDGGNFEASIPYHFFTAEALFLCLQLFEDISFKFIDSNELDERIRNIQRFTLANADKQNRISQIGDNDSGYLLKLYPEDILNQTELSASHILRYVKDIELNNNQFNFDKFGLIIRRDADLFFTLRYGDVGQKGKGGHAHNDALSFTFRVKGLDFFVDPGTYCYLRNPFLRNKYRSTECHNTLSVKGKEQNIMFNNSSDDLFWMIEKSHPRIISISDSSIHAVHSGFGNKAERIIYFEKNKIACTDKITCTNICTLPEDKTVNFHLHPAVEITEKNNELILANKDEIIKFIIGDNTYFISDYYYSPAYGKRINAKKITLFSHSHETNWEIVF